MTIDTQEPPTPNAQRSTPQRPTPQRLSLGISPCPNDVFIFSGILLKQIDLTPIEARGLEFQVDFQDVENLNQRSQLGELDIVKISYANYPHCQQHYNLLPCGGALGRGVGPLLLTNAQHPTPNTNDGPIPTNTPNTHEHATPNAPPPPLLVPGVNTTANFLLDFYANLEGVHIAEKRFLPFDALYAELLATPGARGVVIHEKRFTYDKDGLTLIQDLGEYWEQRTGYAIPLGAICVRRDLGLDSMITDLVRRSLAWAYAHYDQAFALCQQYAQDLSEGVIESHIHLYVNAYSENLGAEGESAVNFFLAKQRELSQN